ncbi:MAG TPA: oligosaccharide flippase family protein [Candidatus Paceibacterota bacterium]|nr:oligosaccharide flippase family protein [Candidatus Paceibacterota bacterium]
MKASLSKFLILLEKYIETDINYVLKGFFWILLGKTGLFIISFIIMTAFANFVPKATFGSYQYILAVIGIVSIFSMPGINISIIKSIAQNKYGTLNFALKQKIFFSFIGSIILICISAWYLFNKNNLFFITFFIAGLLFPLSQNLLIFREYWIGIKKFSTLTKYEFLSSLMISLFFIPILFLTNNLFVIIFSFLILHIIFEGIFYLKTKNKISNDEIDVDSIKFGKSLTIINSFSIISNNIDKIIIWKFLGPIQLAIYSVAFLPIRKIKNSLPISTLALPKMGERDIKTIKNGLKKKFWKLIIFFLPISVVLYVISPFVYNILFPKYTESVIYFQILCILIFFIPFTFLESALISDKKESALYKIKIIFPILKIILFSILIPFYGLFGVIFSILISEIIKNLMIYYYFEKI